MTEPRDMSNAVLASELRMVSDGSNDGKGDPFVSSIVAQMHEAARRLETMGWQPIETAPEDGEFVLLGQAASRFDRSFGNEGHYRQKQKACFGPRGSEGWYFTGDDDHARPTHPTHWMPLPKGPLLQTEEPNE